MATQRARRPPPWLEIADTTERLITGRPRVDDVEPGAAVREALSLTAPPIANRRS